MPSTTAKATESRIAELEEKVEELANYLGRVTAGIFGDNFEAKYDCGEDGLLVWNHVPADPEDPDDIDVGWWVYKAPGAPKAASGDA